MKKILNVNDGTYYSDMAYSLKKHAGMIKKSDIDSVREKRIINRTHAVSTDINGIRSEVISPFLLELFSVVEGIYQKAGEPYQGFKGIAKYPDLVTGVLDEMENRKSVVACKK